MGRSPLSTLAQVFVIVVLAIFPSVFRAASAPAWGSGVVLPGAPVLPIDDVPAPRVSVHPGAGLARQGDLDGRADALGSGKTEAVSPTGDEHTVPANFGVEVVSQIGGRIGALAVRGQYAYLGIGPRLVILDIANPRQPTKLGETTPVSWIIRSIALLGDYAYVATGMDSQGITTIGLPDLHAIHIADPTHPTVVCSYDTPGFAHAIAAAGYYLYVADFWEGLRVVDVADPQNPREVGSYFTVGMATRVVVADDFAYVACVYGRGGHSPGLEIIDVSDPEAPAAAGFLRTEGIPSGLAVAGAYDYVVAVPWPWRDGGLRVVDVVDPSRPVAVGQVSFPGYAADVAVSGRYAYVATQPWDSGGSPGLRVVDVADPAQPGLAGFLAVAGNPHTVVVSGQHAYVAEASRLEGNDRVGGGLRVIDVSRPGDPIQVGLYDGVREVRGMAVVGSYAYLTSDGDVRVLDFSSPARPMEVAFDGLISAGRIEVAGDYAYVVADRLHVLSLRDPQHPVEVGALPLQVHAGASPAIQWAEYAYVAGVHGIGSGVHAVDISDPARPVEVGYFRMPAMGSRDVTSAGGLVYVADTETGLWVLRFGGQADVPAPSTVDWDIADGHFFSQTGGDMVSGYGYAVTDDATAHFWTEFRRLGGVDALGYPVSRRFVWDGFVCQAFQRAILQWRPETGQAYLANLYDELSRLGKDDYLLANRNTPRPADFDEAGLSWEEVVSARLQLLDQYPAIRQAYYSVGDWLNLNGLPVAPVARMTTAYGYPSVLVLRTRRAVIQQWLLDTPWARAGDVTFANSGDLARELGIVPETAARPENPAVYRPR